MFCGLSLCWNIGDTADTSFHIRTLMLYLLSLIHVHKSYNDTIMILWMSFLICFHACSLDYVHVHACIIMLLVDVSSEMNC